MWQSMSLPAKSTVADLQITLDRRYLPLTGGVVSGPVDVPGPPDHPDQAANKAYVDAAVARGSGAGGAGVSIRGTVGGAATPMPVSPAVGDMWLLAAPMPVAAPHRGDGSAAQPGDGVVWDGSRWVNTGPLRGPEGPQGQPGADGGVSAGAWSPSTRYHTGDMVTHPSTVGGPPVVWIARADNLLGQQSAPGAVAGQWQPVALDLPDTGWHDAATWIGPEYRAGTTQVAGYAGYLRVRRVGSRVAVSLLLERAAAGTDNRIAAGIPSGWRPDFQTVSVAGGSKVWVVNPQRNTGSGLGLITATDLTGAVPGSGASIVGTVEWSTSDPWPTAMPGPATPTP